MQFERHAWERGLDIKYVFIIWDIKIGSINEKHSYNVSTEVIKKKKNVSVVTEYS